MPTILRIDGFRFFFYSNEESRIHVHVEFQGSVAKIWLDNFTVAENIGFKPYQLNVIQNIARKNEEKIKKAWFKYFRS